MVCWKLVRDRVPLELKGRDNIVVRRVEGSELITALKAKIVEEALELICATQRDRIIEEAADLLEALEEYLRIVGVDLNEVQRVKIEKKERLGGFREGLVVYWLDRDTC